MLKTSTKFLESYFFKTIDFIIQETELVALSYDILRELH